MSAYQNAKYPIAYKARNQVWTAKAGGHAAFVVGDKEGVARTVFVMHLFRTEKILPLYIYICTPVYLHID